MIRYSRFARLAQYVKQAPLFSYDGDLTVHQINPRRNANGRAVLCIHGSGGAAHNWGLWAPVWLSLGYRVFAVDLRGHHGSGGDAVPLGQVSILAHHVPDVHRVISAIACAVETPIVMVGHSMGALIALEAAKKNEFVAGVAAVACAPPAGVLFFPPRECYWSTPQYVSSMYNSESYRISEIEARALLFPDCHSSDFQSWHAGLEPVSGKATTELVFGRVHIHPDEIACPVLFLIAKRDRIVPVSLQERVATTVRAEKVYTSHGHAAVVENREGAHAVSRWLTRLEYV